MQNHAGDQQHGEEDMQETEVDFYPSSAEYDNTEELSLEMLKDSPPGQKPLYPFSTLIRCAIKGSKDGRLLLEEIYAALENRFEYFRSVGPGWKNTIRHTLSLHPSFEKIPRPLTDRGKGCYWTINEVIDPRIGVQRVRKRKDPVGGKRPTRGRPAATDQPAQWFDGSVDPNDAASRIPGEFGFTQFDAQGNPYPLHVSPQYALFLAEDAYEPEIGPDGQPDWHAIWKNELRRLRHATIEQMRAGAGTDWYKMMAQTVRGAFMIPVATEDQSNNQLAPQGDSQDTTGAPSDGSHPVLTNEENEDLLQTTLMTV